MAAVSESEFFSSLKSGKLSKVYWLYGKNYAFSEQCAKKLVSKIVKKGDETYNLHSFQGAGLDVGELAEACEMLPVFADHNCCTVCDLNADQLSADSIKELTTVISDLPEETVLIIYNTSADICDGKKYPTPKNKKVLDVVSKVGVSCNFELKKPADLARSLSARAEKLGCSLSQQNAAYLAELYNSNIIMLDNELDKLAAYADGSEITRETIDLLSADQLDSTSFDLARAITMFDSRKAMTLLNELFIQKTDPISILYAVTSGLMDMYRARLAIGAGKYIDDVIKDFSYPRTREFVIKNAFRDVRQIPLPRIRNCVRIAAETDRLFKSSAADPQVLLQEAIVKMLSQPAR